MQLKRIPPNLGDNAADLYKLKFFHLIFDTSNFQATIFIPLLNIGGTEPAYFSLAELLVVEGDDDEDVGDDGGARVVEDDSDEGVDDEGGTRFFCVDN